MCIVFASSSAGNIILANKNYKKKNLVFWLIYAMLSHILRKIFIVALCFDSLCFSLVQLVPDTLKLHLPDYLSLHKVTLYY